MGDMPLIWTTKGNLPVATLTHQVEWRCSQNNIIFIERYLLAGELVKESTHIHVLEGAAASSEASI